MNPALSQEFHFFCEQVQLQKHTTLDKNSYCYVYGSLEVVAKRHSAYCETKGLLPEEEGEFRPNRSTTDVMFVVRRLCRELGGRQERISSRAL